MKITIPEITITTPKLPTLSGRSWRWGLLPVLVLAVALLLMLSWGHRSSQEAQAGVPVTGLLLVTFEAKPPLDPAKLEGLCIWIRDGFDQAIKNKACDGGPKDEDLTVNRAIQLTLAINNPFLILKGVYSPEAQTTSTKQFQLDPAQVPGNGEPKRTCDFLALPAQLCDITFSYAPTPSADFSLSVDINGDGVPECDTKVVGDPKSKCSMPVGTAFTVQVSLNSFTLPDKDLDGKFGYTSFQARLNFGAGLGLKQRALESEIVWPDCDIPAELKGANTYTGACTIFAANESTFTGVVMEVDFNCNASGSSVFLVHGAPSNTFIIDENGNDVVDQAASEAIQINCKKATPDFNLAVFGVPESCATFLNDKKCLVPPGGKFTVQVFLDSLGNVATNGYGFMEVGLSYSPGLTRQNRPGLAEMVWPDCSPPTAGEIDLGVSGDNRAYRIDCIALASSFFTGPGPVVEVDFVCPQDLDQFGNIRKSVEYVTIVHGTNSSGNLFDTFLVEVGTGAQKFETPAAETLVIQCDNYFPWDVHGPNQSVELDGKVDLFNDIVGVVQHIFQTKP